MGLYKRYENDGKACIPLNEIQQKTRDIFLDELKKGNYKEENAPCPICINSNLKVVSEKDRYGIPYNLGLCNSCGLGITSPRMTADSYKKFYNELYRKLYLGFPVAQEEFFQNQRKRAEKIFYFVEDYGFNESEIDSKVVVEIGCGAGGILDLFRSKGAKVIGVDFDEEYIEYGKQKHGLDLYFGDISLLIEKGIKADLIIYSHVVEHILDFEKEFNSIKKVLKPKGSLYVEVPGIKNIHVDYDFDYMRYVQNAHTYHFTKNTLINLLVKNSFQVIKANEVVRSISKLNTNAQSDEIKNEFDSTIEYIHWLESKHTPMNKMRRTYKKKAIKFVGAIFKIVGLYGWVNRKFLKSQN